VLRAAVTQVRSRVMQRDVGSDRKVLVARQRLLPPSPLRSLASLMSGAVLLALAILGMADFPAADVAGTHVFGQAGEDFAVRPERELALAARCECGRVMAARAREAG
jgi:hypothetical protein